jgi:hypothetical protein
MDGKKESQTASPVGRKFTSVQALARRWNVSVLDYESRSTF